jgi:hypothetical protein
MKEADLESRQQEVFWRFMNKHGRYGRKGKIDLTKPRLSIAPPPKAKLFIEQPKFTIKPRAKTP